MITKHKYAVCYSTITQPGKEDKTQTDTYTLADRNHRKEFLGYLAAVVMGEYPEVKRLTVDFTD